MKRILLLLSLSALLLQGCSDSSEWTEEKKAEMMEQAEIDAFLDVINKDLDGMDPLIFDAYENSDSDIAVACWFDGNESIADGVQNHDEKSMGRWQEIRNSLDVIAKSVYQDMLNCGISGKHLHLFFCPSSNAKNSAYIKYTDGELVGDTVMSDEMIEWLNTPDFLRNATLEEKNAYEKALSYLSHSAFSYDSLVKQLEFEGFPHETAVFAVDNCGADWNEQAALRAESYLRHSSFSHSGLVKQLEFEGFSNEQAEYGVSQTGL